MKKTKFTETQIVKAIKEAENGRSVADISRELGINPQPLYNWKKKYSGMDGEQLRLLKELEEENRKLKHMYAELALDNKMLKDVLSKSGKACCPQRVSRLPAAVPPGKCQQSLQSSRDKEISLLLPLEKGRQRGH